MLNFYLHFRKPIIFYANVSIEIDEVVTKYIVLNFCNFYTPACIRGYDSIYGKISVRLNTLGTILIA